MGAVRSTGLSRRALTAQAPVPQTALPGGLTLNRVCRPDVWDDPDWLAINRALAMPDGEARLHRKIFEWTHCVYGLERLGVLGPTTLALGVAAGHERILYYLANRTRLTVATDLYSGDFAGGVAEEAAPDFLMDPDRYAPFPYRRGGLMAIPADALRLPFPAGTFDVAFSLSSIEHFGSHEASAEAVREIHRVLKPGGVACVATEYILEGADHPEFFSPANLRRYVVDAAPLVLLDRLDDRPPPRSFFEDPIRFPNVERTPHIVLEHNGTYWTSVVLFFRKPARYEWPGLMSRAVAGRMRRVLAGGG